MTDAATAPKPALRWTGIALSSIVTLMIGGSGAMKLTENPKLIEMLGGHLGFPAGVVTGIGAVELLCIVLYAVPLSAPLGAVLLTGYLGGAVAAHVRVGDPFVAPLVLGALAWAGLALRNPKILGLFARD